MKGLLDQQRLQVLTELCGRLGVTFNNYQYLHQALIHTSFANESKKAHIKHNERLEFLGDAVLDLIISECLYRRFPELSEGDLTKARAMIVCEQTLSQRSLSLKVGEYLLLGKGEVVSGGRVRLSILADAFEAIIGALYLDQGFEATKQFLLTQLDDSLKLVAAGKYIQDYKTMLQEVVQKSANSSVYYEVIAESGPDHDKTFRMAVVVNGKRMGLGVGKSKKEAEQQAAKQALEQLKS